MCNLDKIARGNVHMENEPKTCDKIILLLTGCSIQWHQSYYSRHL